MAGPNEISGGGLAPRDEGFTQPRSYVEVDSIDEALAKATARGGTVLKGKQQISETSWWAVLADPDGNHIGLYEGHTDVLEMSPTDPTLAHPHLGLRLAARAHSIVMPSSAVGR